MRGPRTEAGKEDYSIVLMLLGSKGVISKVEYKDIIIIFVTVIILGQY